MDQGKIGKFLQELRKEKGLTQEQLAEKMGVARRTVSRWETGNNMPDLDLLIELSDLYDVGLREMLDGERKNEDMDKEMEEAVLKVAEYSNEEKTRFTQRLHWMFVAGFIGFILFMVISVMGLEDTAPYETIASFGLGVSFGMIIIGVIFTSRYASRIREFKMRLLHRQ